MAQSSEMIAQSAEVTACNEFLEYIRYTLENESLSYHWIVKTKVDTNFMTLSIEKNEQNFYFIAFNKDELEFATNTIDDFELTKFDILRQYGWCSSNKLTNSRIGYLEFSWLNQHKVFGKTDLISRCSCQPCLDRFDDLDENSRQLKK